MVMHAGEPQKPNGCGDDAVHGLNCELFKHSLMA